MKLQALTVSVNYSDFLVHTLQENHFLFDKWIILTSPSDVDTQELCKSYSNVMCVSTNLFYINGARFNKFAAINYGLQYLDEDAWVLFLDSDICLHKETRRVLENIPLNNNCIYGIDRLNCVGEEQWLSFKKRRDLLVDNWLLTNANMSWGARLVHYYGYENGDGKFAGWNPLGYFQLCHRSSFSSYPMKEDGADHCDLLFARQYTREDRVHIPELMAIHLESRFIHKGVNWYGRISVPFNDEHKSPSLIYLWKLFLRRWQNV